MKNYVIAAGYDCDGASCAKITQYTSEELAEKAAKEANDWSDGVGHYQVSKGDAERYAAQNNLIMPSYAFDENNKIIDVPPPPPIAFPGDQGASMGTSF